MPDQTYVSIAKNHPWHRVVHFWAEPGQEVYGPLVTTDCGLNIDYDPDHPVLPRLVDGERALLNRYSDAVLCSDCHHD